MSLVTGLYIIYGRDTAPPQGYAKVPVNLNQGTAGEYVYLCYSTAACIGNPITNIQVFAGDDTEFEIQPGYTKLEENLNEGAGGLHIYLCYTKTTAFPPITQVDVIQGLSRNIYPPSDEWVLIDQNCSEGTSGEYTYVMYTYSTIPGQSSNLQ